MKKLFYNLFVYSIFIALVNMFCTMLIVGCIQGILYFVKMPLWELKEFGIAFIVGYLILFIFNFNIFLKMDEE